MQTTSIVKSHKGGNIGQFSYLGFTPTSVIWRRCVGRFIHLLPEQRLGSSERSESYPGGCRRYVGRLRADIAAVPIVDGPRNRTDLALDLDFADHSHFTNAFRREWGLSPSEVSAGF